jgi:hypothetical protein
MNLYSPYQRGARTNAADRGLAVNLQRVHTGVMSPEQTSYLHYSPAIEKPADNEQAVFDELSRIMQHITRTMAAHYRHAYRPVHAKSHGVLVGTLEVHSDLTSRLAQGLFAIPRSYPVILRFSTNPGDLLADSVSSPRGLALKILNVQGDMVPSHSGNTTQDLVCVDAKAFGAPNPAAFVEQIKLLDKTLAKTPFRRWPRFGMATTWQSWPWRLRRRISRNSRENTLRRVRASTLWKT